MESLNLAKEKLRAMDKNYKSVATVEGSKENLRYLDKKFQFPHLASQLDNLEFKYVYESLITWLIEVELNKYCLRYLSLTYILLKNRS